MKPVTPLLTVDAIIQHSDGGIVLVKRGHDPFKGKWALPGGFVDVGETCEKACIREVKEETGLAVKIICLMGVYSDPKRDPRGHTVSIVYVCETLGGELKGADDADLAKSFTDLENLELAFDHSKILRDSGLRGHK
jgi:8-oxo-dGTP diphosphatase